MYLSSVFLRHEGCNKCGSSDGNSVYEDGDGLLSYHCFSCKFTIPSASYKENDTKVKHSSKSNKTKEKEVTMSKANISDDQVNEVKDRTSPKGNDYRGISDEITKFFGVRTEYDESTAEVTARYYPVTKDGVLGGYKVREAPKNFYAIGNTGNDCDLFGSFRFKSGGKYVLIVGGEEDAMAAYQMFKDYSDSKNMDFVTAVVSVTVGEANASKQIAANYEFLNSFDNIIVGFDNDEVGRKGAEKIIPSLPRGKIRIASWNKGKDPNQMLEEGNSKAFLSDFYSAKSYVPAGVLGSGELYERIMQQTSVQKVPFPPFMKKLNEMLVDGIPLGHIINIAASTGLGKTTLINELIYFWIFNSPHMIGVVSMELGAGQYGEVLLSRHIGRKLALMNTEDKLTLLKSDRIVAQSDELFKTPDGGNRFMLVEDREGSLEALQSVIEELVISSNCKVIVIDPLQDILDGLSNEDQAIFMKWAKGLIKSHNISFIYINHMRKTAAGQEDKQTENDIHGSSTITKSASVNILLSRDKYSENEDDRNTTKIMLSKNRLAGLTGPAGELYYCNAEHTLYDKEEYFSTHSPSF